MLPLVGAAVDRDVTRRRSMDGVNEALRTRGWALVEGVSTQDTFLRLACHFGIPVAPHDRPLVQRLLPTDATEAAENTYSSRYGRSAFPFHTDYANWTTPPRYILMRSVGATHTVPTIVLDSSCLPSELTPDLRAACFRARAWSTGFACNVLSQCRRVTLFRWDPHTMNPLDSFARTTAASLVGVFDKLPTASSAIPWEDAGRVLLLDNWRVLHARPDASNTSGRCLERVLVSAGES